MLVRREMEVTEMHDVSSQERGGYSAGSLFVGSYPREPGVSPWLIDRLREIGSAGSECSLRLEGCNMAGAIGDRERSAGEMGGTGLAA
jgi:hypothetical protein